MVRKLSYRGPRFDSNRCEKLSVQELHTNITPILGLSKVGFHVSSIKRLETYW